MGVHIKWSHQILRQVSCVLTLAVPISMSSILVTTIIIMQPPAHPNRVRVCFQYIVLLNTVLDLSAV